MTYHQMSLLSGAPGASRVRALQAILEDDLAAVQRWGVHDSTARDYELECLLRMIRLTATELRTAVRDAETPF